MVELLGTVSWYQPITTCQLLGSDRLRRAERLEGASEYPPSFSVALSCSLSLSLCLSSCLLLYNLFLLSLYIRNQVYTPPLCLFYLVTLKAPSQWRREEDDEPHDIDDTSSVSWTAQFAQVTALMGTRIGFIIHVKERARNIIVDRII